MTALVAVSCLDRRPFTRPSYTEALRLAGAYADGAYMAAGRAASRIFPEQRYSREWLALQNALDTTYPEIRDFLIHEHDVDERVAMRIAMRLTRPLVRIA